MELTSFRQLYRERDKVDHDCVTVGGWVRSIRGSKTFGFIMLSDGTFFEPVQVVYDDKLSNFAEISKYNVGSALVVKGKIIETPEAQQPFEIHATEVNLEGASTPDYPLQKSNTSEPSPTSDREQTSSRQCSEFALSLLTLSISSSRRETSYTYTLR